MKKLSLIIVILLSIFCSGCKKTHCPAFPANLNYFPYFKGQELKFTNSQQNIRSFIVLEEENSNAYSFEWNCKCACEACSLFSTSRNQDSLMISGEFYIIGGEDDSNISTVSIYFGNLRKKIDFEKSISYNEIYKYVADTIIIEDIGSKPIRKIVTVKNKGLISYTTADGEEWRLVE